MGIAGEVMESELSALTREVLADGKVDAKVYKEKYYRALGLIMGDET